MISRASTPRKRAAAKKFKAEREAWREAKGTTAERDDPDFLAWVRTLECFVCLIRGERQKTPTEAAHLGQDRGMGQKPPDRSAGPLCHADHLEDEWSHHKATARHGQAFWDHLGLDRDTFIQTLNERYEKWRKEQA